MSSAEVREAILTFLDGDPEPWAWDDFTSIPIDNPFLDAVRRVCIHVHDAYPPDKPKHYCSDEGAALMREIAIRLP